LQIPKTFFSNAFGHGFGSYDQNLKENLKIAKIDIPAAKKQGRFFRNSVFRVNTVA
jgi:hypothetical protein